MPFCYGGGVTSVEEAKKIINLGAEKVALSSAVFKDISLVKKIADTVGVQSVVVVIDVKKKLLGGYDIYTLNGTKRIKQNFKEFISRLNEIGVGEIVINSIDQDGEMKGYDLSLVETVRSLCDVPVTVLGGAGSYDDIKKLINQFRIIGAAAGSLFVLRESIGRFLLITPTGKRKWNSWK